MEKTVDNHFINGSAYLGIQHLANGYRSGAFGIEAVMQSVLDSVDVEEDHRIWIQLVESRKILSKVAALNARWEQMHPGQRERALPLYGLPFAVKDNIDVAGMPTTAGCPRFAYVPEKSATVVSRLEDAGAVLIGKTNMDQFATGLTGTRSPHGACKNAFRPEFISGGSSSGSAVAVALGMVSFALGTDTAGSGRVPAAFNNIVGLKPTRGLVSTAGVVPACRSLDCVSVFAGTCEEASVVAAVITGLDDNDPYCVVRPPQSNKMGKRPFRFAVPDTLVFFGDTMNADLFHNAVQRMQALGGQPVGIDFSPFEQVCQLLYDGPWVAERWAALGSFISTHPDEVNPTVRQIISEGNAYSAADVFQSLYELQQFGKTCAVTWNNADLMLLPTSPTIYSIAEVAADPVGTNKRLGYYTNFVNLLDLAALAVPSGMRPDGLPFGVSLIGPAASDAFLADIGHAFQVAADLPIGATGQPISKQIETAGHASGNGGPDTIQLAVVGAHLSGLALNWQLTDIGATLHSQSKTAAAYRLYHLPDTTPPKPGLVRVPKNGACIDVEVWEIPLDKVGDFMAQVPAPLCIGTLLLDNGQEAKGFICESHAVHGALDITHYRGWRHYLRTLENDSA